MADSNTPPTDTGRFTFESDGFRYEVFRTLLEHVDYDTLFLSWCRPSREKAPRRLVVLEMIAGNHPLDPQDVLPPRVSKRALRLVSGVRTEHSAWASIEVLADRLLRFGPEDVEHIAHKAPAPLKEIIHRAVRSDPTTRHPSAAELRDDLRAYLRGLRQPFGAPEAAAELADILEKASALERKAAHPVEMGVLPWPKASSIR